MIRLNCGVKRSCDALLGLMFSPVEVSPDKLLNPTLALCMEVLELMHS